MDDPELTKQHIYSKSEAIALYSFFFACVTFSVTILSIMCDILPQHYIMHAMVQGLTYGITYKVVKYIVSNGIAFDITYGKTNDFDLSKKITDDMCNGVWPHRDYMNSNSVVSTQYRSLRNGD
jgi:hypothetical protein